MAGWPDPGEPEPQETPPPPPDERVPEPDPEAQQAPGAGQEDPDFRQPPMEASANGADVILMDAPGLAGEPVGNDNIREGRVRGVMGPAHQQGGQGQGG